MLNDIELSGGIKQINTGVAFPRSLMINKWLQTGAEVSFCWTDKDYYQ